MRPHERVPFRPSPDFNPRTPVGCDGYSVSVPIELRNFNPRTPVGCDRPIRVCFRGGRYFNPRTPVGCDEGGAGTVGEGGKFQSTHPSGVRRHHVGRRRRAGPISIHAPQWGATVVNNGGALAMAFQSTHPSGVRPWEIWACMPISHISIHAPQWGATRRNGAKAAQPAGFQSTHPSGVRRFPLVVALGRELFQSTHPSGVRLADFRTVAERLGISIHAPQWGATHGGCGLCQQQRISIHAPQWGATGRFRFHADRDAISIHAPQWGATQPDRRVRYHRRNFNPRTPVGCDHLFQAKAVSVAISIHAPQWGATSGNGLTFYGDQFQSTHPSGVRRYHGFERRATPLDFNPRTPVGCDLRLPLSDDGIGVISIHAPQWGATRTRRKIRQNILISIHAPQWGATVEEGLAVGGKLFQSTHPSGVRQVSTCQPKPIQYFNPRTPVGCDGHVVPHAFQAVEISIHAPQWGATHLSSARYHTLTDFNPRTPVGCDMIPVHFAPRHTNFNPRTPVGCDLQQAGHGETQDISIHAPQWGATKPPSRNSHARPISIHAPQWGATII